MNPPARKAHPNPNKNLHLPTGLIKEVAILHHKTWLAKALQSPSGRLDDAEMILTMTNCM
jgi:hypothetical protein